MKLTRQQLSALEVVLNYGIDEGFYLAGGTAITIKYNHRHSEDFDFFTIPGFNFDILRLTKKIDRLNVCWLENIKDTAIFEVFNVKFSFFEFPYPLIKKLDYDENLKISLASDVDIACMKALAITQRGSKKDFFDLWYLMKKNFWDLCILKEFLRIKYKNFNFGIFLKALTYFEDANKENFVDIDPKWDAIKDFFQTSVKNKNWVKF
ncbi:MAG: hypothetical protein C0173_01830 [Desulfurella sp.]|uniref:Nucleotidyl transferase AbiEii toxin, Type IV TA system n=1 Tax=Thermodesulfobium acidiphilum TaxID=1794699 RepID=A0A2R4W0E0_THEAF|nr:MULTISPECIES: nucleotidyl transferase AbiEii/AbiGii toxin family protein [Bacteria]AWB10150.1 Nucleotidyl transferase AbiEii toxin, Type IV TA system [Thermodesulfobium acidiphilum]PMP92755.1 MAG: hypothetical protein C0173_01830 [Desulfurella sp.]